MSRALLACAFAALPFALLPGPSTAALDGPRITRAERETTYLVVRANRPGAWLALRDRPGGRVIARVRSATAFGTRPALGVVREEGAWLGVSSAELPNRRLGWVRRDRVRISLTRVALVADLSDRTLALRVGGRIVRTMRVGIGARRSPTPTGRFAVTDKFPGSLYGSYLGCCVLVLSGRQPLLPPGWIGGDLLGIHGTSAGWSIGHPTSAGCLRAAEGDLLQLMEQVPVGAPVFIQA